MVLFLLVAVAFVIWSYRLHRRYKWFQYLFFWRFPLLFTGLLLAVPLLAHFVLEDTIGNWFTEMQPGHAGIILFFVLVTAGVTHSLLTVIVAGGPRRFELPLVREGVKRASEEFKLGLRVVWLALPFVVWALACKPALSSWKQLGIEAASSLLAFALVEYLRQQVQGSSWWSRLEARIASKIGWFLTGPNESGDANPRILQLRSILFCGLVLIIYVAVAFLGNPGNAQPIAFPIPVYPVLMILVGSMVFTGLSYRLDGRRIPVSLVAGVYVTVMYGAFGTDQEYEVLAPERAASAEDGNHRPVENQIRLSERQVVENWSNGARRDHPVAVVVTASGGGISAAYWTATILTEIWSDERLGALFSDGLILASGVSGGSVGLAHALQDFSRRQALPADQRDDIRKSAATSSLGEAAWGMACADLPRLILPAVLLPNRQDRGWALEQAWRRAGLRPDNTLLGWRDEVAAGERPTVIFNATLMETGQRLTISTHDHTTGMGDPDATFSIVQDGASPVGWSQLYPKGDIRISTAARLSATFPYVTPVARPRWYGAGPAPECFSECRAYHVGDGGYYDNDGLLSALEFLSAVKPVLREQGVRAVLLIRIRAGAIPEMPSTENGGGLMAAAAGPITTMMNVRGASQVDRNRFALRQALESWNLTASLSESEPRLLDVSFVLEESVSLSWHLAEEEKSRILAAAEAAVADQLGILRQAMEPERIPSFEQKAIK